MGASLFRPRETRRRPGQPEPEHKLVPDRLDVSEDHLAVIRGVERRYWRPRIGPRRPGWRARKLRSLNSRPCWVDASRAWRARLSLAARPGLARRCHEMTGRLHAYGALAYLANPTQAARSRTCRRRASR